MGWKEFVAAIFASLVTLGWPVVGLTLGLVLLLGFRAEFAGLIGRLRKAEGFGVKGEFSARIDAVEESAEQVVAEAEEVFADQSPGTEPRSQKNDGDENTSTEPTSRLPGEDESETTGWGERWRDLGAEPVPERYPPWLKVLDPTASVILAWERLTRSIGLLYDAAQAKTTLLPPLKRNRDGTVTSALLALTRLGDLGLVNEDARKVIHELSLIRNDVAHGRVVPDRAQAVKFVHAGSDMERYLEVITKGTTAGYFDDVLPKATAN